MARDPSESIPSSPDGSFVKFTIDSLDNILSNACLLSFELENSLAIPSALSHPSGIYQQYSMFQSVLWQLSSTSTVFDDVAYLFFPFSITWLLATHFPSASLLLIFLCRRRLTSIFHLSYRSHGFCFISPLVLLSSESYLVLPLRS